jgi:hypothetical protein
MADIFPLQLDELQQKLDDQTALSNSRFSEIQELVERNKLFSAELERCQIKVRLGVFNINSFM